MREIERSYNVSYGTISRLITEWANAFWSDTRRNIIAETANADAEHGAEYGRALVDRVT
jgi:hypothetical protein